MTTIVNVERLWAFSVNSGQVDETNATSRQLLQEEHDLLVTRHTNDLEAYHLFLRGRHFLNRRHEGDFGSALASFRERLRRDPSYILLHRDGEHV